MSAQLNNVAGLKPAPHTDQFVEVAGLRLHYQDYGAAGKPPILCVHGSAAHAHWFDFVAAGFNRDHHVRAIDQRGHGDSQWDNSPAPDYSAERYAADLNEVAEKLDLRDFVLVGHSMGGLVSTVYASTYPGRAKAFVLIDSSISMSHDRIASMREAGNREGRSYATQKEFAAQFRLRPTGGTAAPEVLRHLALHSGRQFDDGRWRYKFDRNVYAKRERMGGYPYWSNIKIPALLVKGDRSARITPEIIAEVRSRAPQVKVAEVANSDHHITLDNAQGFVQVVNEFLNKNK